MSVAVRRVTGRGYRLWIAVDKPKKKTRRPLVILCHGLGVASDYPLLKTLRTALLREGHSVCRFDFAGHGKSGGTIRDRLVQNCIADLKDVVDFAGRQDLASEGIILIGHSIGALTILLYAGLHPRRIVALVPIASNAEAKEKQKRLTEQGKIRFMKKYSIVGRTKVSKNFWKDRTRFEPKKFVSKIQSPVLYLVGSQDRTNPPEESRLLLSWTKPKDSAVRTIPGADHYFRPRVHQQRVVQRILPWLRNIVR